MKYFMFVLILLISGCATTDIELNMDAMKSVKTVAVIPFTSKVNLKKEILAEAEESCKKAFLKMDYRIMESNKLNEFIKGNNISSFTAEDIKKIGKATGSDAVLFGEITEYKEATREVMFYPGSITANMFSNKGHDELKYITTYTFRIIIRLVNVADGSEILTMKNRTKEIQEEENLQCCNSLNAYRKYTLDKMTGELIEAMKEKK